MPTPPPGKLSAAFPARCSHVLHVKPGSSTDLDDLLGVPGGGGAAPVGSGVPDGHSVVFKLTQLWHRAISRPEGPGGAGHRPGRAEGGEGGGGGGGEEEDEGGGREGGGRGGGRGGGEGAGEVSISMSGFFLACSSMHEASAALGPFVALANKNDQGNLRKLKKVRHIE